MHANVDDKTSFLGALAASLEQPVADARAIYPSELPGARRRCRRRCTATGSGTPAPWMTLPPSLLPLDGTVTFAEAGVYPYVCLIHPFMKATITVQ